jgi:adenylate cyclase
LVQVGIPTSAKALPVGTAPKRRKRFAFALVAVGSALLLVAIAAGVWWFLGAKLAAPIVSDARPPPAHLSIVVLPFANLSGDPAQDYFADSVTENLTTELSRIHNSFVIARNTAFSFKGKPVDAKAIGKELGVRYVLEGSVQRAQNRVRVNVQLIDAESGAHLWSDGFEDDVADLLKLQDEVVARLANRLGYELVKAEAEKGARSKSPDAIDLTMRGQALLAQANLTPTKEAFDSALALFDQALNIDPNEADALSGEASAYGSERTYGWKDAEFGQFGTFATLENEYTRKILAQADRAIALAPDNVQAYSAKSRYLTGLAKANEAVRVAEAGLAINPNSAPLYEARSIAKMYLGRHEEAKSDIQLALKLSPRDSSLGVWQAILGDAELCLGHFDAAIDAYQKSIDLGFRALQPYTGLAAAYALEERMSEAKDALAEARRINPKATIKYLVTHERPWVAWYMPNLLNGLKKAGLPYE